MRRFLPLLFSCACLALPATAHATTYGSDVGGVFLNQARNLWTTTQAMSSLNALYAAGGRLGRADSNWQQTEPKAPVRGRHHYNWASADEVVGEMSLARLRWQPTLQFAPRWAQHGPRLVHTAAGTFPIELPPYRTSYFAAYATAFMRRYGPHGAFWKQHRALPYLPVTTVEVWNEPDNKREWGSKINLGNYAAMYEAVRTAVHRVDRHARVVTGGLAWTQSSLPRLLKAFRHKPMDALAFHPYGNTPTATVTLARFAIREMRKYGRGRTPLLANEYGWTSIKGTWGSTASSYIDRYSYQALIGLSKLHLAAILPFLWDDPSWGLSDGTYAQALRVIHR
jgi:hypothetical protein